MDAAGGCGSTRSPASSRTLPSTTSRRRAGAYPSTSGSFAGSGSTSSLRSSMTARSRSRPGAAASRRSRPVAAGRCRRCGWPGRGRQRLDPPRADLRPAGSATSGRTAPRPKGGPVSTKLSCPIRRPTRPGAVGSALDRSRRERPCQQRGVLAGRRRRAHARGLNPRAPHRAELDYRDPIDLDDRVEIASFNDVAARRCLAFVAGDRVRAVAVVGQLDA